MPRIADLTTATDQPILAGRVNIHEAPRCVLMAVPGLEAGLVDRILAMRDTVADAGELGRRHALWLLTEELVDLATLRDLDAYVTGGGDVFRAQLMVRRPGSQRSVQAEVVVDASQSPPRLVYRR